MFGLPLLSALPWLIAAAGLVIGGGGTLWYRSEYHECQAAREADRLAAEKARATALAVAAERSDAIIATQARALAETSQRANTARETVIRVPVTTTCAGSPAVRAALDSLRDLTGPAGGGSPQAIGGPAAPLPATGNR